MNFLRRGFTTLTSSVASIVHTNTSIVSCNSILGSFTHILAGGGPTSVWSRCASSLYQMHRKGPLKILRDKKRPLDGAPFAKGVVLKTLIKKPKKPNSANRKCVLVRLSSGKEMVAYVPGIGHNLQEHNIVLVRCGRVQDCPGVKLKCVRGKFDLPHVIKTVL